MRHLVEQASATGRRVAVGHPVVPLGGGRHVVEALRPQKERAPRAQQAAPHLDALAQGGVRVARREGVVPRAALGVEPPGDRHSLEQGRLARAVLAHEERHVRGQRERPLPQAGERGNVAQEGVAAHEVPADADRLDERRGMRPFEDRRFRHVRFHLGYAPSTAAGITYTPSSRR